MRRGGDGGSDGEAAGGCDSSGIEGHKEHDSERETDTMEVDWFACLLVVSWTSNGMDSGPVLDSCCQRVTGKPGRLVPCMDSQNPEPTRCPFPQAGNHACRAGSTEVLHGGSMDVFLKVRGDFVGYPQRYGIQGPGDLLRALRGSSIASRFGDHDG